MNMLLVVLLLLTPVPPPDYAALVPAVVDAARATMLTESDNEATVGVHMGSFISLLKRETGASLDVSSIAQAFADRGSAAVDRSSALDCSADRCRWTADEIIFVELERVSRSPDGEVTAVARIAVRGGHAAGFVVNVVEYDFRWDGEWILEAERVKIRS